jgi:hypothetical protein
MSRIDVQQDEVGAAAVEAVGGQMNLLRRRQVDEANVAKGLGSKLAPNLSGRPVIFGTQMYELRRRPIHVAILPDRLNHGPK